MAGAAAHDGRSTWASWPRATTMLPFAESAGGGLFAQLMVEASEEVDRAGSIVGHEIDRGLIHLRRQLEDAPSTAWRVTVDEVDRSGDYIAVETMNIRHAGPSIPIAPDADPGDGLLDVVLITSDERDELMDYIDQRLAQHEIRLPGLMIYRGTRIELAADGVPMRIDDKVVAQDGAQWSITIEPGAVQILGTNEAHGR